MNDNGHTSYPVPPPSFVETVRKIALIFGAAARPLTLAEIVRFGLDDVSEWRAQTVLNLMALVGLVEVRRPAFGQAVYRPLFSRKEEER